MSDDDHSRESRYGKTERKNVTLTSSAITQIQEWADEHGLYFSVALESLALLGLDKEPMAALPRLIGNMLEKTILWQFNRFAKLLSVTALAAEESSYKMDVLLLQTIWREARQDPNRFTQNLVVSKDPQDRMAAYARQLQENIKKDAKELALVRLKKPLSTPETLFTKEEASA